MASRLIQLLVVCFIVGVVLVTLGLNAADFWAWVADTFQSLFGNIEGIIGNAILYISVGAAVVLPIYAIILLSRFVKSRSERRSDDY